MPRGQPGELRVDVEEGPPGDFGREPHREERREDPAEEGLRPGNQV